MQLSTDPATLATLRTLAGIVAIAAVEAIPFALVAHPEPKYEGELPFSYDFALAPARTAAMAPTSALRNYEERPRKRTAREQRWSSRTVDLMHLSGGAEITRRDALFGELDSELARIHAHDA